MKLARSIRWEAMPISSNSYNGVYSERPGIEIN